MANPSIGGHSFIFLRGAIDLATGTRTQDITRANVDGVAFRQIGKRSDDFDVISEGDVDVVSTAVNAYKALEGTLVTVVDDAGVSETNVAVRRVVKLSAEYRANVVGGITAGNWWLRCQWTLRCTETT